MRLWSGHNVFHTMKYDALCSLCPPTTMWISLHCSSICYRPYLHNLPITLETTMGWRNLCVHDKMQPKIQKMVSWSIITNLCIVIIFTMVTPSVPSLLSWCSLSQMWLRCSYCHHHFHRDSLIPSSSSSTHLFFFSYKPSKPSSSSSVSCIQSP